MSSLLTPLGVTPPMMTSPGFSHDPPVVTPSVGSTVSHRSVAPSTGAVSPDALHDLLGAWCTGRAKARGTSKFDETGYGWVGFGYPDSPTRRHVIADLNAVSWVLQTDFSAKDELKLPGSVAHWAATLPSRWCVNAADQQCFMTGPLIRPRAEPLPAHYHMRLVDLETHAYAHIMCDGHIVAQAHAGLAPAGPAAAHAPPGTTDVNYVTIFDQVSTRKDHRRHGLSTACMAALSQWGLHRRAGWSMLMSTPMGVPLYTRVGLAKICLITEAYYRP